MKYALIMAFTYEKSVNGDSRVAKLVCAESDLTMASLFCLHKGIAHENITILTDLSSVPDECSSMRLKYCCYPESEFVCRELAEFIENTIRGIEDTTFKSEEDLPEVFVYVSGHGAIVKDEQGIVLLDNGGTRLRYLTTRDLFSVLFGKIAINPTGVMRIPVYARTQASEFVKEAVVVRVTPATASPHTSPGLIPKPHRSSYLMNRGIPPWTRVLFVIDTCHSANMTHFPYIYSVAEDAMMPAIPEDTFGEFADMPYCVSIASCGAEGVTRNDPRGSPLTKRLYGRLREYTGSLNTPQLYHYITDCHNWAPFGSRFSPVVSSTSSNPGTPIPFFYTGIVQKPKRIER
jgi:hypothetical protein